MKKDVVEFVYACLTCHNLKVEHQRPSRLVQPLNIPEWRWDNISMDFVTGLPKIAKGNDFIWVIVDRLTKSAHFLSMKINRPISMLAEMYIEEIVRLHRIPSSIVSDRDPRFRKILQDALGESAMLRPEIVKETTVNIRMIHERMKSSQSYQKSYHDKRTKTLEFQVDDHVFMRVSPTTGASRDLKSRKLTPHFIGPYHISERVGEVAYQITFLPSLANLHDVFHVP
ncbi:uncharacterized protein LOC131629403 [Vicia villosa]|uniref:uncharacterized protein LOC131629403 n=1 Tax=Vicia villosa TaxID=3911 RepID=UPI00273AF1DE|nr:uncharacterized protein LOC131629403 [Vicia villosa]